MQPWAVIMTTVSQGCCRRMFASSSMPSMSGILMSARTRSTWLLLQDLKGLFSRQRRFHHGS